MPVEMPVPKSPLKYAGTKRISGCVSAGAGQDKKSASGNARTAAPLALPERDVTQRAARRTARRRRPRQSGGRRLAVLSRLLGHGVGTGLHRLLFVAVSGGMFLQRGDRLVVPLLRRLDGALDPRLRLRRYLGEKIGQDLDVPGGCIL